MTQPRGSRVPALGARGEGWVIAQLVLLVALLLVGILGPAWGRDLRWPLRALGAVIGAIGVAMMMIGARRLGRSLTPFPKPLRKGVLEVDGLYARIRHPIYAGVIVIAAGWSLLTSPAALIGAVVLGVFFDVKSHLEEMWLLEHYEGYGEYRQRVRWKFVPGIR